MKYLDMSYSEKLEFWKKCSEDDRLKIKIEECAKYIQNYVSNYTLNGKNLVVSIKDCYDYSLQNGGYFKYTVKETEVSLELFKEDIMPYYDVEESKDRYMFVKTYQKIDNIIACWPESLSLVESFYCNDAMLSYGHDVRVPFNQGELLFCEIYAELTHIFPDLEFNVNKS